MYCIGLIFLLTIRLSEGQEDNLVVLHKTVETNNKIHAFENTQKNEKTSVRKVCFEKRCILQINSRMLNTFNATFNKEDIMYMGSGATFHVFDNITESSCVQQTEQTSQIWHLTRINSRDKINDNDSYLYSTHDDGQGVTVYVLDSGVNINHMGFEGRASQGFVADDAFARDGTSNDLTGHGTFVAGLVCSKLYGVAKSCNITSVKVISQSGSGTEMDIISGLHFVYNEAQNRNSVNGKAYKIVCNLSFGTYQSARAIEEAVKELHSLDVLLVTAAGNENQGSCKVTPGKMAEVLNVGATNELDQLTDFSNWGSCVNILAPGKNIASTGHLNETHERISDGTSYSAPIVTGVVARYLSYHDGPVSVADIKSFLQSSSTKDVIDLVNGYKYGTPNQLVFANCTELMPDTTAAITASLDVNVTSDNLMKPFSGSSPLTQGQIVGISLGAVLLVVIVLVIIYVVYRKKTKK